MSDNLKVKVLMLKGEKGEKGETGSISNLKIGGVNLLNESTLLKAPSANANWDIYALNISNREFVSEGVKVKTSTSGTENNGIYIYLKNANSIVKAGDNVTFSVDLKGENVHFNAGFFYRGDTTSLWSNFIKNNIYIDKDKIDDFIRYSFIFVMPDVGTKDKGLGIALIQGNAKDNCEIIYRNAKLEREETPTDWTPSIEDIENEFNNIKARLEALEAK